MQASDQEAFARAVERWEEELRLALTFVPADPTMARERAQRVERELRAMIEQFPEQREPLERLCAEAQVVVERSVAASERFRREAEQREQQFQARERRGIATPLSRIRRPWPEPQREA